MTENNANQLETDATSTVPRILYIDNVRIYLTILLVVHHIAVGYGGSGDWGIRERYVFAMGDLLPKN